MKRTFVVFFLVLLGMVFGSPAQAAKIFHASANGDSVFLTNSMSKSNKATKELFATYESDIMAVAPRGGLQCIARNKGDYVEVQTVTHRGKVVDVWNIWPEDPDDTEWLDMSIDPGGLWAVTEKHALWTPFGYSEPARVIDAPEGYSNRGVAYDPTKFRVFVLVVDKSGYNRQPAIIFMTPYGVEVGRIFIPGFVTSIYQGLGYDSIREEFWFSTSMRYLERYCLLVNTTISGTVIKYLFARHEVGAVECRNDIPLIIPNEPIVTTIECLYGDMLLVNGYKLIAAYSFIFDHEEIERSGLKELVLNIVTSDGVWASDVWARIAGGDIATSVVQVINGKAVIDLSVLERSPNDGGKVDIEIYALVRGVSCSDFLYTEITDPSKDFTYSTSVGDQHPDFSDTVQGICLCN